MRVYSDYTCEGCPYNCRSGVNSFIVHNYTQGEQIVYRRDRNYVVFIVSGSVSITSDAVDNFRCQEGQIVLLLEKNEYRIEVLEDCQMLMLVFIRSYQICDQISIDDCKHLVGSYKYVFHALESNEVMKTFVRTTVDYIKDGVDCEHILNAKQLELFIISRFYYSSKEVFEFYYPIIDKLNIFQSLIKKHFDNAKNVKELAFMCGYSLPNFNKAFAQVFKESPYQWMRQQNVKRVRAKLLDKEIPIKVIVVECGFTSPSHLNKFCKQYLGGTATQVRKGNNS